ncbi:hypothetical protein VP01_4867g1 [Puccinia sorghi]|uniref:Uncharacterized protein n=1 Tax=Puccinia sorghi TaxID=27349 RepID=A0A0L6UMB2_9BASI|nr:hypothetical protein VP01_4867g1 [Puccinia sorghi]
MLLTRFPFFLYPFAIHEMCYNGLKTIPNENFEPQARHKPETAQITHQDTRGPRSLTGKSFSHCFQCHHHLPIIHLSLILNHFCYLLIFFPLLLLSLVFLQPWVNSLNNLDLVLLFELLNYPSYSCPQITQLRDKSVESYKKYEKKASFSFSLVIYFCISFHKIQLYITKKPVSCFHSRGRGSQECVRGTRLDGREEISLLKKEEEEKDEAELLLCLLGEDESRGFTEWPGTPRKCVAIQLNALELPGSFWQLTGMGLNWQAVCGNSQEWPGTGRQCKEITSKQQVRFIHLGCSVSHLSSFAFNMQIETTQPHSGKGTGFDFNLEGPGIEPQQTPTDHMVSKISFDKSSQNLSIQSTIYPHNLVSQRIQLPGTHLMRCPNHSGLEISSTEATVQESIQKKAGKRPTKAEIAADEAENPKKIQPTSSSTSNSSPPRMITKIFSHIWRMPNTMRDYLEVHLPIRWVLSSVTPTFSLLPFYTHLREKNCANHLGIFKLPHWESPGTI